MYIYFGFRMLILSFQPSSPSLMMSQDASKNLLNGVALVIIRRHNNVLTSKRRHVKLTSYSAEHEQSLKELTQGIFQHSSKWCLTSVAGYWMKPTRQEV